MSAAIEQSEEKFRPKLLFLFLFFFVGDFDANSKMISSVKIAVTENV